MAIYVTGDIHGDIDISKLGFRHFTDGKLLTKDDFVIIAGDFGIPWRVVDGKIDRSDLYWLKWLDSKPFTTLFIDGNHENHEYLDSLKVEKWNGGNIHRISKSVYHLMRGQVFNLQGKKFWVFGGAASHDMWCRTEGINWWPREIASQSEMTLGFNNLEKNNMCVDYIVTHTPPALIKESLKCYDNKCNVASYLDFILNHSTFDRWYCGHMHIDLDFENPNVSILMNRVMRLI